MNRFILFALTCLLSLEPTRSSADEFDLRTRFGEQQFSPRGGFVLRVGQKLPDLAWEHPEVVAKVLNHSKIPTRWFNVSLEQVQIAEKPGRYYAYGEAPVPSGPPLRRAMTCCCIADGVDLESLAKKQMASTRHEATDAAEQIKSAIDRWKNSEKGAVELAAIMEAGNTVSPARVGQWQMENATWHVRLKRKLMGIDNKPVVKATVSSFQGEPTPELRKAQPEEVGISVTQVSQMEAKLDEWYANSREPMAVVIARNGVIVVSKGYGIVAEKPVSIATPMLLHSAMKPLIGLQLAMYVDQGFIRLDEPIGNYLPEFDSPRDQELTFRAAHIHATGIHFPWELAFRRLFYFHTWHEALIAHCRREWKAGTRHQYGVVGVILSVRALELLRGRNYWDAMERDIFEPLGIRDMLPGGTGFSAENMARIGVVLANHGKYGEKVVISEKTYAAIVPTSLKPYFPALDMQYGIGLQDHSKQLGPGSYGHGGGCGTLLSVNPEKHLVFAMVRNAPGKDYKKYRSEVLSMLRNWIDE